MTEYHVQQEIDGWKILDLPPTVLAQTSGGAKVYHYLGAIVRIVEADSREDAIAKAKQAHEFRQTEMMGGHEQAIDVFPWAESAYNILRESGWQPPTEPPQT